MKQDGETQRQEAMLKFQAEQKALDRQSNIQVAEIRSAGYTGMVDLNKDQQSDYIDTLEYLDKKNAQEQGTALAREKELNKNAIDQQKVSLQRQELQTRKEIADKQLQVARTNKNKYDKEK